MAYIIEWFIFKWITAKLHPWEVFIVHTVLWKSSPAWQSVTCTKHMVIKSRVRDSNCKLCTFRKLQESCNQAISCLLAETLKVQVVDQTAFPAKAQINIVSPAKINIFFWTFFFASLALLLARTFKVVTKNKVPSVSVLFKYEICNLSQAAILHCYTLLLDTIFFPKSKTTQSEIFTFFNLKIVLQKSLSKESL